MSDNVCLQDPNHHLEIMVYTLVKASLFTKLHKNAFYIYAANKFASLKGDKYKIILKK